MLHTHAGTRICRLRALTSSKNPRPFPDAEYEVRIRAVRAALEERALDALLLFSQESHYYLFGYDGTGYVFFQSVVLPAAGGEPVLLCRLPDVAQARDTSSITDVRVWLNAEDACPARELKAILSEMGLAGARVGIELDTYGLTAANYLTVARELEGFCELVDASSLVRGLRLVKSATEIELVRRAAALADDAVEAIAGAARPGVLDSSLAAVGISAVLDGGGDPAPGDPLVNSGPKAVYGRSVTGPRPLGERDQLLVELAGTFRRYNCCIERTVVLGAPSAAHHDMYLVVRDAIDAAIEAFRPGAPLGRVDEVHRSRLDAAGYSGQRYAACGYSLGATYRPSWMDVPPMIYAGNPLEMRPGMVFFPHVMLGDRRSGMAVGLGNTVLVTENGAESLSRLPLDLLVRD